MFKNHINRSHSGFIVGAITWLMFAAPFGVFAQSPLTVQPSTGRVGIGNTNPSEALDVSATVKATAFKGDGSNNDSSVELKGCFSIVGPDLAPMSE